MKIIVISSILAYCSALPQSGSNLCGTNERGLPRQAGDTWMEECNRCRCTDNLLPGCTKRFCNIPASDIIKPGPASQAPGTDIRAGGASGGGVQFPGVVTRDEPLSTCTDNNGKARLPGDKWKNDCNDCSCTKTGQVVCTLRFCINIQPLIEKPKDGFLFSETGRDIRNIIQCQQAAASNCRAVQINSDYLSNIGQNGQLVNLIPGSDIVLQPKGLPKVNRPGSTTYVFQTTDGGEALFTVNEATGGVYGSVKPLTGDVTYTLEAVSPSGSVIYETSKSFFHGMED